MLATASTSSVGGRRREAIDRDTLRLDADGQFTCFGDYMHAKIRKLNRQVHHNDDDGNGEPSTKSTLFAGLSFYVNGYTNPPALELRHLIVGNGGEYHHYYAHHQTNYTLATNLSVSKWRTLRADEKVLRPEWITKCIKAGCLLPEESFLLRRPDFTTTTAFGRSAAPPGLMVAAVQPAAGSSAVSDFYQRSRLHLISTLAQELKAFVVELRRRAATAEEDGQPEFPARQRLAHLSCPEENGGAVDAPIVCHIDMDCFFVAVALRNRPELRGRPVAVTHSKATASGYGEIASCSYEARACGVRSSMLVHRALALCPALVCLPYEPFDVYRDAAKQLYTTVASYSLHIRAVSCDELYVNLTSLYTQMRVCDVGAVVAAIRADILNATHCHASAGIGSNALLARLATRRAKPNGQFWVRDADRANFMATVALRDLPGVGYAMETRLRDAFVDEQLADCQRVQRIPLARLQAVCGEKSGLKIYESCRGISNDTLDVEHLDDATTRKSVSCDVNFGVRLSTKEELWRFLDDVAIQLTAKLDALRISGSALTLKLMIRAPDAPLEPKKYGAHGPCTNVSRTFVYAEPARSPAAVASAAKRLAAQLAPVITDIRGIGLQMTRLTTETRERSKCAIARTSRHNAGQPSITSFMKVRKTPSPIVCLELDDDDDSEQLASESVSSLKAGQSLPALTKKTKRLAPLTKKKAWSIFAVPKSIVTTAKTRRRGRSPASAAATVKVVVERKLVPLTSVEKDDLNAQRRSRSKTELKIVDGRMHVGDITVDFAEAPSQSTVDRLERLLIGLVGDLNIYKTGNFYSFLARSSALPLTEPGWTPVVQTLKARLNAVASELYGAVILE